MVLTTHYVHTWKVIHLLVWLHLRHEVWGDGQVMPGDVPLAAEFTSSYPLVDSSILVFLNFLKSKIHDLPSDLLDHIVLSTVHIHINLPFRLLLFHTANTHIRVVKCSIKRRELAILDVLDCFVAIVFPSIFIVIALLLFFFRVCQLVLPRIVLII